RGRRRRAGGRYRARAVGPQDLDLEHRERLAGGGGARRHPGGFQLVAALGNGEARDRLRRLRIGRQRVAALAAGGEGQKAENQQGPEGMSHRVQRMKRERSWSLTRPASRRRTSAASMRTVRGPDEPPSKDTSSRTVSRMVARRRAPMFSVWS